MDRLQKLTELFSRFPGIGPRQAKRFVFYLLMQPKSFHNELATLISELSSDITRCKKCQRYFTTRGKEQECVICAGKNRNTNLLMIVEKDVDLDNIERSDVYDGLYFVLGGTVPILEEEPHKKIRSHELKKYIDDSFFDEVILALSANPDGDYTGEYIKKLLKDSHVKISELGRGLSTGSELEYSDQETIKNAFKNRH